VPKDRSLVPRKRLLIMVSALRLGSHRVWSPFDLLEDVSAAGTKPMPTPRFPRPLRNSSGAAAVAPPKTVILCSGRSGGQPIRRPDRPPHSLARRSALSIGPPDKPERTFRGNAEAVIEEKHP